MMQREPSILYVYISTKLNHEDRIKSLIDAAQNYNITWVSFIDGQYYCAVPYAEDVFCGTEDIQKAFVERENRIGNDNIFLALNNRDYFSKRKDILALLKELLTLDLSDHPSIINWLEKKETISNLKDTPIDDIDDMDPSPIPSVEFAHFFWVKGFLPKTEKDPKPNPEDEEQISLYLIGRLLDDMMRGHGDNQELLQEVSSWRKKFNH